jgi:hypothetical protein
MQRYKYLKHDDYFKEGDKYQLTKNSPWKEIYPEWIGQQKGDVFDFFNRVRRIKDEKNNIAKTNSYF